MSISDLYNEDLCETGFFDVIESLLDYRGKTPLKLGMSWSDVETPYLALSALNVKDNGIDTTKEAHYGTADLYKKWMKDKPLREQQILMTTEAPAGVVMQIPDNRPYILSQRVIALNVDPTKVDECFFAYLLRSHYVQNQIERLCSGGTAKGISQKHLKELKVRYPKSIKTQQKIAEFFTALDEKIRLNAIKLSHIRSLKSNVARTVLFQHKGIQLNSWVEVHLSDVAEFIKTRDTFDSCIYVGTEHLNKDFGGLCKEVKDTASGVVFKENDILLSNIRPYLKKLWLSDCKGVCSADVLVIRSKSTILPSLLKHILSTDVFFDYVAKGYKGSKMPRGDKDHIELFEFMIPSDLEVQRKIADQLDLFEMMIFCLINKDKHLELLKKAFMQRMFV